MKLKAEDLMIGNILDFNGMECVVKEIDSQGVVVWIEETKEEEWIDLFQFSGIPITEDWLIKLGYKYYQGKTEGNLTMDFGGKIEIDFYEGKLQIKSRYETYHLYRPLSIKFVHQLQNIIKTLNYEATNN